MGLGYGLELPHDEASPDDEIARELKYNLREDLNDNDAGGRVWLWMTALQTCPNDISDDIVEAINDALWPPPRVSLMLRHVRYTYEALREAASIEQAKRGIFPF